MCCTLQLSILKRCVDVLQPEPWTSANWHGDVEPLSWSPRFSQFDFLSGPCLFCSHSQGHMEGFCKQQLLLVNKKSRSNTNCTVLCTYSDEILTALMICPWKAVDPCILIISKVTEYNKNCTADPLLCLISFIFFDVADTFKKELVIWS